jgi:hypothetical protein
MCIIIDYVLELYKREHCDVIHCHVKCQPEIDWLVKQSTVQHIMISLVGKLAS